MPLDLPGEAKDPRKEDQRKANGGQHDVRNQQHKVNDSNRAFATKLRFRSREVIRNVAQQKQC